MKTLDQVEARTPIDAAHTPGDATNEFNITQAGSYYLTGNLNVAKTNGIHITVAGVSVDLNGFQIARTAGSGSGILLESAANNCTIRNGSITGFSNSGIAGGVAFAGILSHVIASNCTLFGFLVGDGWLVENCNGFNNTNVGIQAGDKCTIRSCTASNNAGNGITVSSGSTLVDCTASANQGGAGISTGAGCTLTHCTARSNTSAFNTSAGIVTGNGCTITACTAEANTSTNATLTGATGAGINAGSNSKVENCAAAFNKGDGIKAGSACSIVGNVGSENGVGAGDGAGVHVTSADNRIEGNNVTSNDRGIDVDGAGNLIIKNSASGNPTNYAIAANNVFGEIKDRTAPASAAVAGNSAASTAVTLDPWANISY